VRTRDSLLSFDLLRLASAAAVAFGHCWALYEDNNPLMIGQVRVGRCGVAILCAIGGYFAFLHRSGPSWPWLRKRLARVYPPYWVTYAILLASNHWFHQRPVTWGLVVSEFCGTGYFTHGYLLGVHLWFISLILACYCLAAILRRYPDALPAVVLLVFLPESVGGPEISGMMLSFFLGAATAVHKTAWLPAIGVVAGVGLGVGIDRDFQYLAAAGVGLLLARTSTAKSPGWVASAAQGSYEFYLLHPIAFLAFKELLGTGFVLNFLAGSATTVLGVEAMETGLECVDIWSAAFLQLLMPRQSGAQKETAAEAAVCISDSTAG